MFDLDKWQEIFNSISRHKLRTALTALGVFWGIFMLIILLGAGNGLQNGVQEEFKDDAINSIWVRRGTTSMPFKGLPKGRRIQFTNEEYDLLDAYAEVEHLSGRFYLSGNRTVTYKDKKVSFPVRAVHPGHKHIEYSIVTKGRYLNEDDIKEFRKVAVIGDVVHKDLFGEDDPIGKEINVGGIVYKIVGIYTDRGSEGERRIIYLPVSTAQKLYAGTDRLHQLMFTIGDMSVEESKALEKEVRAAMAQQLQFDVEDRKALYLFNGAEQFEEFTSLFSAIELFVWFVGIGSIIAGVIGVSNIMLIIVKDRTKEIGIRKALGATPYSIVSMILQESIFITAIAGYMGLLAGVGVIALLGSMEVDYFKNPQVDFGMGLIATIILVVAGSLAGLMPAMQAARINPVVAMKTD